MLLEKNPRKRITAEQAIQHEWFKVLLDKASDDESQQLDYEVVQ